MRSLLTGYAGAFNRRHKRVGRLFQNRYRSVVVEEDPYLLELVRYVHLNPLRGSLVRELRELQRYPWTGHAALCGRVPRPWQATADILARFAREPRRARAAYRAFVAAGVTQGRRADLQGGGLMRSVGGWQAVQDLRRGREAHRADERVLGSSSFVEALLREAERQGEARARSRVGPAPQARQVVAYLWVERLGRPASELARAWGWSRGHATWAAKRGAELTQAW